MKRNHISLLIIMISLSLFCCYHIYYSFHNKNSNDLVRSYYKSVISNNSTSPVLNKISDDEKKEKYFGIISIPKIRLKTGFYKKDSSSNNVNKSVTLLKESILPENNGSIIYLAAHSGTGYLAYFKDLDKLSTEDIINISINGISYQYVVYDSYELPRNGHIVVERNVNENYLVLTTCGKDDTQLVVIAKMFNKV